MTIQTINPATGRVIQSYAEMNSREVEAIIESTHIAFMQWRNTAFSERGKKLKQAGALLEKNKQE